MLTINPTDLTNIFTWWFCLFILGLIFTPITSLIFNRFIDKGYIFSKTLSLVLTSYTIFALGTFKLLSFSSISLYLIIFIFGLINLLIYRKNKTINYFKNHFKLIIIEEIIFLLSLVFWCFIRGNLPDIHGLEKFMDFGLVNSIVRTNYFPAHDIWYSGLSINYYYFGHLITAVLIKLTNISSFISYNLMLCTLFALTFTSVISLAINLFNNLKITSKSLIAGILSASLVTLGGNLTAIYTFFKPYVNEHPVPFWTLDFAPFTFPNNFWYPNATRFIPFTIHEFPLYSFVVSDLHGHVLDIPIVLLTISFIFNLFLRSELKKINLFFAGFLAAVMYMTNAWDGLIYILLSFIVLLYLMFIKNHKIILEKENFIQFAKNFLSLFAGFILFSFPFSVNFKPFVSGVGILCAPSVLTNIGKIGPFLFETNHCQKSPIWQLIILYGFFYFFVIVFLLFLKSRKKNTHSLSDKFVLFLILLSTLLIIIPEFIYIKDIYPMHYRANTMFKLTYEAFMMLSICCGYIILRIFSELKNKILVSLFFIISLLLIYLILSYPIFAINSYYNNLKNTPNLNGLKYMQKTHLEDFDLINWINKNISGYPVILESAGDSYTDYARISANTGIPTIIGWSVHEWLWRGSYNVVGPRVTDVQSIYTSNNTEQVKELLKKYNVKYVVVSNLEKQKYKSLNENNFQKLGSLIYDKKGARLYKIN